MSSDDKLCVFLLFLFICILYNTRVNSQKFRICVVDGKDGTKKSARYCPVLDSPDSQAKCVLGIDRLDCLRKIFKKKADFGVFTSEDLITASNSGIEGLITNELRYTEDKFEYEVVAVINNDSGINSRYDLKDKKFCHPGYDFQTDWTKILSNYMEASVIPQLCDKDLTVTENSIKASSDFWNSACKAGPWVSNTTLDSILKKKYPNLCKLCDTPNVCSKNDKYWGRRGSLFCLTDKAGDVSWARLDDVKVHFGLSPGGSQASPDNYRFFCPDGTIRPLNSTNPCVWVVKPWDVVVSERTKAQDIQKLVSTLTHAENTWQSNLLDLIESYNVKIINENPVKPIETYLQNAPGFLSANSFSECHPPRLVRMCTTSVIENNKCEWLREVSSAYGVLPSVDCLKADNTTHCMDAVQKGFADIVMVSPDHVSLAERKYSLTPLVYETVHENSKYLTVGVSKKESSVRSVSDLEGAKACFPTYDGIAYNSVANVLTNLSYIGCSSAKNMASFFGDSCVPGLNESFYSLVQACNGNKYDGELGALQCLIDGRAEVSFISKNTLYSYLKDKSKNANNLTINDFNIISPQEQNYFSWAPIGQAMIAKGKTEVWIDDATEMFFEMDVLFGKNYKSLTSAFSLYGPFNEINDLLFHDDTAKLRSNPNLRNVDNFPNEYEIVLNMDLDCKSSASAPKFSWTLYLVNVLCLCSFGWLVFIDLLESFQRYPY